MENVKTLHEKLFFFWIVQICKNVINDSVIYLINCKKIYTQIYKILELEWIYETFLTRLPYNLK